MPKTLLLATVISAPSIWDIDKRNYLSFVLHFVKFNWPSKNLIFSFLYGSNAVIMVLLPLEKSSTKNEFWVKVIAGYMIRTVSFSKKGEPATSKMTWAKRNFTIDEEILITSSTQRNLK